LKEHGFITKAKVDLDEYKVLPDDQDEFNEYFIDFKNKRVKNRRLLSRRLIGSVSHFATYSKELFPDWNASETLLEMEEFQFKKYEEARIKERKMINNSKKPKKDNVFKSSSSSVYRFYSRAIGNFVFPEGIKRPFPSYKEFIKEVDEKAIREIDETETETDTTVVPIAYEKAIHDALTELSKGDYLDLVNLGKYSPKMKKIIERCNDCKGLSMVYSQFRTVEGLGVLSIALKRNGWAELKVSKSNGEWKLNIREEDANKPKFMVFNGSTEETSILLKIFNNQGGDVIPELKSQSNLYGELVKLIMITASGSEGISLKNVREVHIMEPYWNQIRIDQIIGRAVRAKSHLELPPKERNVAVHVYVTKFSEEQLKNSFTIRAKDASMTSDEYIYDIAKVKSKIINDVLDVVKNAAIDCSINGSEETPRTCFSHPKNDNPDEMAYTLKIIDDPQDVQILKSISTEHWTGKIIKTQYGKFILKENENLLYDYGSWKRGHKLVFVGKLKT
jgi:hypothetical protein